jgi:hypothetical protein
VARCLRINPLVNVVCRTSCMRSARWGSGCWLLGKAPQVIVPIGLISARSAPKSTIIEHGVRIGAWLDRYGRSTQRSELLLVGFETLRRPFAGPSGNEIVAHGSAGPFDSLSGCPQ